MQSALGQFTKSFTVVELDDLDDPALDPLAVQDYLGEKTGAKSVPRVFIAGKFIGGGDDTAAAAADGRLKQWLVEAEVIKP